MLNINNLNISSLAETHTLGPRAMIFFIAWVIVFILAVIFGVIFAFIFTGKKELKRIRDDSDFNVRVYSYDYAKQTFYFFDMMDMSHTKTFTAEEFYAQFSKTDAYLVEDWLRAIAHNEKHPEYIQADIKINSFKKLAASMLQLTIVNRQKNIIHFNSHLLPNSYMTNMRAISRMKNRIPHKYFLKNFEECQRFMDHSSLDSLGATYFFRIYCKESQLTNKKIQNLEKIAKELLVVLARFLSKDRKLIKISKTEVIMIDNPCISKIVAMNTAETVLTHVQQFLNHNTSDDEYHVAIGISNGTYYQRDFNLAKEQTCHMADAIMNGLSDEKVLFYDEAFFKNYQQTIEQREEVKMVIKNAPFRNYFTPTLDITDGSHSFYLLDTLPYGTNVSDFFTVINMAKDMDQVLENLFNSLIEKCLIFTKKRTTPLSIAIRLPYDAIKDFTSAVEQNPSDMIKWIFIIDEVDLLTSNEDPSQIAQKFYDLNQKGYQIAIVIENPSSGLRTRILRTISYFFVPPKFTTLSNDVNRSRTDLRTIQSSYSLYRVPIVYYGLKDFNDIELGAHFGGRIFQCDELALRSSHVELIDPNKIEEVISDTRNLIPRTIISESNDQNKVTLDIN